MKHFFAVCLFLLPLPAFAATVTYGFDINNFNVRDSNNGTLEQTLAALGVTGVTSATVRATFDDEEAPFQYFDRRISVYQNHFARYTLQSYEIEIGGLTIALASPHPTASSFIQVFDELDSHTDNVSFNAHYDGSVLPNGARINYSTVRAFDSDVTRMDGIEIPEAADWLGFQTDRQFSFYVSFNGGPSHPGSKTLYGEIVGARQLPGMSAVPLPASGPLLLVGFALLLFIRQRGGWRLL